MKRSYGILALAVLAVAGLVLAVAPSRARRPHDGGAAAAPAGARLERSISIVIQASAVRPARRSVPKGSHVVVEVENRDPGARRLALLGYEDRVRPITLPAGAKRILRFDAVLPGGDFAWIVDGAPAGRLVVEGSHLVEGHR